jgi:hypothetical protein
MYLIDSNSNTVKALEKSTFASAGFRERQHLQEWIASNPEILGEPLLIVQKEFDGFNDTYERLDLLALDKAGNLVIIENKLDDSGRDVTWQAIKYASYASTLNRSQLVNIFQEYLNRQSPNKVAGQELRKFFDDTDFDEVPFNQPLSQRIFLVASNFRKEVTSTVLWLMNFQVRVQCFKAVHYALDGNHYFTLNQILPVPDAQDYMISMAAKAHEERIFQDLDRERFRLRKEFWAKLIESLKGKSPFFQGVTPSTKHWLRSSGLGIGGVSYVLEITKNSASVYLNFGRILKERSKTLFDTLNGHKAAIETSFGSSLLWERRDDRVNSRVRIVYQDAGITDTEKWGEIIDFMAASLLKLHNSVKPFMAELSAIARQDDEDETQEGDDQDEEM